MRRTDMTKKILEHKVDTIDRLDALENAVNANAKAVEHNQRGLAAAYQTLNRRLVETEEFIRLPWWKRVFRSLPAPLTIEPKKEAPHDNRA